MSPSNCKTKLDDILAVVVLDSTLASQCFEGLILRFPNTRLVGCLVTVCVFVLVRFFAHLMMCDHGISVALFMRVLSKIATKFQDLI